MKRTYFLLCILIFTVSVCIPSIGTGQTSINDDIRIYFEQLKKDPPTGTNIRSVLDKIADWYDIKSDNFQYLNYEYEKLY